MKQMSFEQAMKDLEEIVAKLEDGEESLEKSLELFEKGAKLAGFCNEILANAEQKVTELTNTAIEKGAENV
ncbi:MAG: exodeoxyribonuclease VII small subunit [Clostridia bacterium]|nr:exodeoxyribonuclease VII small subunit [Clostridia bacterium]